MIAIGIDGSVVRRTKTAVQCFCQVDDVDPTTLTPKIGRKVRDNHWRLRSLQKRVITRELHKRRNRPVRGEEEGKSRARRLDSTGKYHSIPRGV